MAEQKIDTEQAIYTISMLRRTNRSIKEFFGVIRGHGRMLEREWKGRAANKAISYLCQFEKDNETRSDVMQNYINQLEQQVVPGYEQAENVNLRLSDKFK